MDQATRGKTEAYVQRALVQAGSAGKPTAASLQQAAMDAYTQSNPGASAADAWNYVKGFTGRNANWAARLGVAQGRLQVAQDAGAEKVAHDQVTETNASHRLQLGATAAEDAAAGRPMPANPRLTYAQAGPAPVPPPTQPSAAPSYVQPSTGTLANARSAIARGASRDAVITKLRQQGVDPSGL